MELLLVVALWLFALVHIDSVLVLVAFCADERYHFSEVLLGHYLGFTVGLAVAVAVAIAVADLFDGLTYLLGLVPLVIGLYALIRERNPVDHPPILPPPGRWRRTLVVTVVSIGLSGENIAVFVPLFAGLDRIELAIVSTVYLVAAGIVFGVGWVISQRLIVERIPAWIDRRLVPMVLIAVGGYVLVVGAIAA